MYCRVFLPLALSSTIPFSNVSSNSFVPGDGVIVLLRKRIECNPKAGVIHVVLDNFKIHDSRAARAAVEELDGRVVPHFLPPYCPDHNRIERVWLDLHANVTRNHRCADMPDLMANVDNYLRNRNQRIARVVKKSA